MINETMHERIYRLMAIASLFVAAMAALFPQAVHAQDSPCNQGRGTDKEPRSPWAICLPEFARRYGVIAKCGGLNRSEDYGRAIYPLGDVSHDGLADWIVTHTRCDTGFATSPPLAEELMLYRGVRGGIPPSEAYERIGASEVGSITRFLACGDWDADGNKDLAVRIQILGDTSARNVEEYEIARLVIFWGDSAGRYSLRDTSRLECDAQMWLSIDQGGGGDIDGDGVDDLLVGPSLGLINGHTQDLPKVVIYRGHRGGRWGRGGIPDTDDWRLWNIGLQKRYTRLAVLDQDGDGARDVVMIRDYPGNGDGGVSIIYGRAGALPDTSTMQTIAFAPWGGRFALFEDITGDRIPELLICSGASDFVFVYAGLRNQRLLEQYGTGYEPEHPGAERWWGRPWAQIWLPRRISAAWFGDDDVIYDLGDLNLDGVGDITAFAWPYLVCYNGGVRLDSLVDALHNVQPGADIKTAVNLGDVDGAGVNTIAVSGSGIAYLHASRDIPLGPTVRKLVPGTGKAGVEKDAPSGLGDRPWLSQKRRE